MTGRELAEEGGAAPPLPTSVGLPTTHFTYYTYYIIHTTSYKRRPPYTHTTHTVCDTPPLRPTQSSFTSVGLPTYYTHTSTL